MSLRSFICARFPCLQRVDYAARLTRDIADNIHAHKRRRSAETSMTLVADTQREEIETTLHRIEGRSGDRRTSGEAAIKVAEATLSIVRRGQ